MIYNLLLLRHAVRSWEAHSTSPLCLSVIVQTLTKCSLTAFVQQPWKPECTEGTTHSISMLFSPAHELWDPCFICFTFSNTYDEYRMINYFKVLSISEYKYVRNIDIFSFKTLLAVDWCDNTLTLCSKTRKAVWLWPKTSTNFTCVKARFFKTKVPLRFHHQITPRTTADTWGNSTGVSTRTHGTSMPSPLHVFAASFSVSPYSISAFLVVKVKNQMQLASHDGWQSQEQLPLILAATINVNLSQIQIFRSHIPLQKMGVVYI